ncbi:Choline-sulfatase [Sedimentisphaera cyanobacteriorum]|uniref:Choline-sulfatase n=1 Tax=Sedimentisphaera cyanobacteriorum TaxID=1940790 RepID=A0A1Q2HSW0_9BACT|nr:sulfatase [Sedimentisphaera cyanobacteriorum]AQQ10345.1 Choline-sulfatase [Sedimentisphaera cyanobacteriorum]
MQSRRSFLKNAVGLGIAGLAGNVFSARSEQDMPNFLWLTIEDTSAYEFGCYGNKTVKTPNIDSLAKKGIRFTNAWSNGPQCTPARSTLITGCYATKYGMDYHGREYKTPGDIFYPDYLRKIGYYCTNNHKTHYNTQENHKQMWDECNNKASYSSKKRPKGKPFFSIFNTFLTHMGRVRSFTLEGRRDFSKDGIEMQELDLPEHVPDIDETRSDYAFHLEGVQDVDKWVGLFLKDLREKDLADDTIIFFYSDHGGSLPRGKAFVYNTGLQVPLIIYVPPKWQHLVDFKPGTVSDRLVSFVDFPATVFSIAGKRKPSYMQGKAFMGKYSEPPRKYQFGFRCNQGAHYDPARTVSDGKYKYIRSYIPHKPRCLRNFYQWGMPANLGWDEYVLSGGKKDEWLQPYRPGQPEMLFDIEKDPQEINNIAEDEKYKQKLKELRGAISNHIREAGDLGFFPESTRHKNIDLYSWVREKDFPLEELHKAAEQTSEGKKSYKTSFLERLKSKYTSIRFWGAAGFAEIASKNKLSADMCPKELEKAMDDDNDQVAMMAAEACCYYGKYENALDMLLDSLIENNNGYAFASLETMTWHEKTKQKLREKVDLLEKNKNSNMVRALLVNLGKLPASELYKDKYKKKGIKVNEKRRAIWPTP